VGISPLNCQKGVRSGSFAGILWKFEAQAAWLAVKLGFFLRNILPDN